MHPFREGEEKYAEIAKKTYELYKDDEEGVVRSKMASVISLQDRLKSQLKILDAEFWDLTHTKD